MSDNPTKYVDGWFGKEREITVRPNPGFPFGGNPTPDTYSRTYDRQFQVVPANYVPKIANRTAYTNLLTYSQDLTNAAWAKNSSAAALSAVLAADGTLSLDSLLELAATAEHSVTQAATVTAAPTMMGGFGKAGLTRSWIRLAFTDSAAAVFYAYFNIASGQVGALSAGVTAAIFPLGNGDFWCVAKFTPAAGAGTFKVSLSADGVNANLSYAGNAAYGAYVWGLQVATLPTAGATGPALCGPYVSTTTASRSVLSPDVDPKDPMAYMATEANPVLQTSDIATVARKFSRVPLAQAVAGSTPVSKPNIPSSFTYATRTFDGVSQSVCNSFRFAEQYSIDGSANVYFDVYSYIACVAAQVHAAGGTFTLTYKTSTTSALNYNASNTTIAAAVNGLASIIADGITVTVSNLLVSPNNGAIVITKSAGLFLANMSMDATSLTPAAAKFADNILSTTSGQQFYLRQTLTMPTTGIVNTGQRFSLVNDISALGLLTLIDSTLWAVVDSTTIVIGYPSIGPNYAGPFIKRYTPGSFITRCIVTSNFYLPGVTAGITTPADIPIAAQGSEAYALLQAIFGNTGTINYVVGQEKPWQGPIYQADVTTVQSADL